MASLCTYKQDAISLGYIIDDSIDEFLDDGLDDDIPGEGV